MTNILFRYGKLFSGSMGAHEGVAIGERHSILISNRPLKVVQRLVLALYKYEYSYMHVYPESAI